VRISVGCNGTFLTHSGIAAEDHFLDIKLRVDLLGKRLLFLGYSFRDENVAKLLSPVARVFNGMLPPSYLIAFDYVPQMEELATTYSIRITDFSFGSPQDYRRKGRSQSSLRMR
jgi:hypothetical protein